MCAKFYTNEINLPNQLGGRGDPFVLRHNGKYYLYPSTPFDHCGVQVWTSENLVDWTYGGYVVTDRCLQNCYAPEVWPYNGQFLLVGSPHGRGHYLYIGDSPLGPFTKVKDNFGLVIDGSIFLDDDDKLYFTHAEYPCIYGHEMTPDGDMGKAVPIKGSGMGHWTEGSGIFKRNGKYYITMTGNHLLSRAYRIDYAISDESPMGPYRVPKQKTLLVNTDRAHGSLGHSSNTIGPDLDSYWICYHNFEIDAQGKHVRRNVNLDRMLFNGEKLMVSGPTRHFVEAPKLPDARGWADDDQYADAFIAWGDGVQLMKPAPGSFTAEINIVPGERAEIGFGYVDEKHYGAVIIEGEKVSVLKNGKSIAEAKLMQGFDADRLHAVRLELRNGLLNVLIDHTNKLNDIEIGEMPGQIGARGAKRISYVAFSRHVGQRSDFEHYHAAPGSIDAALFAPADCASLSGGHPAKVCGFRPEDGMRLCNGDDGGQDLLLSDGEYISYRLNAASAGAYHLRAALASKAGAKLQIKTPADQFEVDIPPTPDMTGMELGEIALFTKPSGFEVRCLQGELQLRRFDIFPVAAPIAGEWRGLPLCAVAHQVEGLGSDGFLARQEGLQMDREVQAMAIFGGKYQTDGMIEADIRFRGDGMQKSAGLFLRLSENSYHTDQILVGHRGYYVGFDGDKVRIDRMDFDAITLATADCPLAIEQLYTLTAQITDDEITVTVDGKQILSVKEPDPPPHGQIAVGSFGARITVERVKIEAK